LLRDWQLPEILSQAVATQGIDLTSMALNQPEHRLGWILQIANTLVTPLIPLSETGDEPPARVRAVLRSAFEMDDERANRMIDEILADYHEVASIFDVKLESQAEAVELYAEAQEEAARVGMVAQLEQAKMLAANRDLLRRATTDPLTGMANRAKFDERLGEELARVRRGQSDLCLIMLDIDHFKKFNDTHGHQVGDLVLKRVATAVGNILREVDLVARYGGEEFVVLAPQTDRKGACVLAARVQRCVQELRIDLCGMRLGVTISSGVAITADYAQPPTPEQFIGDADAQLYLSKKAGRNTWSYRGCSACRLKNAALLAV
jgi:diguanylate cyclase (GGDEF)-like protein